MKTAKFILTVFSLSILSVISLRAGEKEAVVSAAEQSLRDEIGAVFNNVPYEGLMGEENECLIKINFRINENHEVSVIRVDSKNDRLARYAFNKLSHRTIKVSPLLDGKGYTIDLRFVTK